MHVVAVQGDENVVHFKYMSLRLRGGFTLTCNTSYRPESNRRQERLCSLGKQAH